MSSTGSRDADSSSVNFIDNQLNGAVSPSSTFKNKSVENKSKHRPLSLGKFLDKQTKKHEKNGGSSSHVPLKDLIGGSFQRCLTQDLNGIDLHNHNIQYFDLTEVARLREESPDYGLEAIDGYEGEQVDVSTKESYDKYMADLKAAANAFAAKGALDDESKENKEAEDENSNQLPENFERKLSLKKVEFDDSELDETCSVVKGKLNPRSELILEYQLQRNEAEREFAQEYETQVRIHEAMLKKYKDVDGARVRVDNQLLGIKESLESLKYSKLCHIDSCERIELSMLEMGKAQLQSNLNQSSVRHSDDNESLELQKDASSDRSTEQSSIVSGQYGWKHTDGRSPTVKRIAKHLQRKKERAANNSNGVDF